MILTKSEILKNIESKDIVIEPFDANNINPNSVDVCLGDKIGIYANSVLDSKSNNELIVSDIPAGGITIYPDQFYLAVTKEYTETKKHVPMLDGKSSIGRLGIDIHATAGKGDIGFTGHWTLEISVKKPVRIYPGMVIGQLIYYEVSGEITDTYQDTGNYNNKEAIPEGSKLYKKYQKTVEKDAD